MCQIISWSDIVTSRSLVITMRLAEIQWRHQQVLCLKFLLMFFKMGSLRETWAEIIITSTLLSETRVEI